MAFVALAVLVVMAAFVPKAALVPVKNKRRKTR